MASRGGRGGIILLSLAAITVLALLFWTGFAPPPSWGGDVPGDSQPITYITTVVLDEPCFALKPHIESVQTIQGSYPMIPSEFEPQLLPQLLPWVGTLKLTVVPPSGTPIVMQKTVKVEWCSKTTVQFVWVTRQTGSHTLTLELIDGDGVVIDSRTVTV